MLCSNYSSNSLEAGCDEAGRGCLAGAVFAAAVILPPNFNNPVLTDSKKMSEIDRYCLRTIIENEAVAWAVAQVAPAVIDEINILQASILAMHKSLQNLTVQPNFIIVDGNKFKPYQNIKHQCIVKGDAKYFSIAAASVLAKTYRDDYMLQLHTQFNNYNWDTNKGYPTLKHRQLIQEHGLSPYHRLTFNGCKSAKQAQIF